MSADVLNVTANILQLMSAGSKLLSIDGANDSIRMVGSSKIYLNPSDKELADNAIASRFSLPTRPEAHIPGLTPQVPTTPNPY